MVDKDWNVVQARRGAISAALESQARTALDNNKDALARPDPTFPLSLAAQQALVAQVQALTRQNNAIIRLLVGGDLLDS